jgi:hypothetical protein
VAAWLNALMGTQLYQFLPEHGGFLCMPSQSLNFAQFADDTMGPQGSRIVEMNLKMNDLRKILSCVWVTYKTGFGLVIGFIDHPLYNQS